MTTIVTGPGHLRHALVAFVVVSVCGLLLAGCGDADNSSNQPADRVTETVTESPTVSNPEETSSPDDDEDDQDSGGNGNKSGSNKGDGATAGLPPKPRRDECVEVKTPRDGRYQVYDAGSAVIRRDGGRLRIDSVSAARGWQARVTDRGGDDDVEIEFRPRKPGAEIELEVDLDDGRIESTICVDDRDDDGDDDRDDD